MLQPLIADRATERHIFTMGDNIDITHCVILNAGVLSRLSKVVSHVKTHTKRAVVQICGSVSQPELQICSMVSGGAMLCLTVNCVCDVSLHTADTKTLYLAFYNIAPHNTLSHASVLFSQAVREATLVFYKLRGSVSELPECVKTSVQFNDGTSKLVHHTGVSHWEPLTAPKRVDDPSAAIVLTAKTCIAVQKWLRSMRTKEDPALVLCVNHRMSMLVLSVQDSAKTVEFEEVSVVSSECVYKPLKQRDYGRVVADSQFITSLDSFLTALSICKVAGTFIPLLKFYGDRGVDITGLPVKETLMECTLRVYLAKVADSVTPDPDTDIESLPDTAVIADGAIANDEETREESTNDCTDIKLNPKKKTKVLTSTSSLSKVKGCLEEVNSSSDWDSGSEDTQWSAKAPPTPQFKTEPLEFLDDCTPVSAVKHKKKSSQDTPKKKLLVTVPGAHRTKKRKTE